MNDQQLKQLMFCLDELEAGVDLGEIVTRFPEEDQLALRGLLEITQALSEIPAQPTLEVKLNSQTQFLNQAAAMQPRSGRRYWVNRILWLLRPVMGLALLLLLLSSGVVTMAQRSIPGDLLFDTKLAIEDLRYRLAPPEVQGILTEDFSQRRVEEVKQLLATDREAVVQFSGTITAKRDGEIIIADIPVSLQPETQVVGELVQGRTAVVIGKSNGDVINAIRIEVESGDFPIDNEPEPTPTPMLPTNTPIASPDAEPVLPTWTKEPTAQPEPEPTATDVPTLTPAPTQTPSPSPTPTLLPSPAPTNIPPTVEGDNNGNDDEPDDDNDEEDDPSNEQSNDNGDDDSEDNDNRDEEDHNDNNDDEDDEDDHNDNDNDNDNNNENDEDDEDDEDDD